MGLKKQLHLRQINSGRMSPGIINEYERMQLSCIVLSRRDYRYQAVNARYAPFTYSTRYTRTFFIISLANCKFPWMKRNPIVLIYS